MVVSRTLPVQERLVEDESRVVYSQSPLGMLYVDERGDMTRPLPTLKNPEHEIDTSDPWADDLANRRELADQMTAVIAGCAEPLRISLHGPWGTGKTFLLQRWAQDLRNRGFKAVYFSAWEEDFGQDPLVPIFGQMNKELGRSFREATKAAGKQLGKFLVTAAAVGVEFKTGFPLLRFLPGWTEKPGDLHTLLDDRRRELKKGLEDLARKAGSGTPGPLVVIIDELDRCRPTYAVECLERVKHIMEIPGIAFVFGIDRNQLCESVQHVNGNVDASTYLQRFFDFELTLPTINPTNFCISKLKQLGVTGFYDDPDPESNSEKLRWNNFRVNLINNLPGLFEGMGLSLREMQYCLGLIALAIRTIDWEHPPNLSLLGILAVLKIKAQERYRTLMEGKLGSEAVMDYIHETLQSNGTRHTVKREWLLEMEFRMVAANQENEPVRYAQLARLASEPTSTDFEALARQLRNPHPNMVQKVWSEIEEERRSWLSPDQTIGLTRRNERFYTMEMLNRLIDLQVLPESASRLRIT